jgi:hypothetical protein
MAQPYRSACVTVSHLKRPFVKAYSVVLVVAVLGCGDSGPLEEGTDGSTFEVKRKSCGNGVCSGGETCSNCPQDCGVCAPDPSPSPTGTKLTWAPPALVNPTTVVIADAGQACPSVTSPSQNPSQPWICYLDSTKDYMIKLGHRTDVGGLVLWGGHNVTLIGGHITVPERTCCDRSDEWKSRGLTLGKQTGLGHVEGVLISDAGDSIIIQSQDAIYQIENVRIENQHYYRDDPNLGHADVISTFDGPKDVRVDRLTGDSDFTGLSWFRPVSTAVYPAKVTLKNVNLIGNPPQSNTVSKWPDGTTKTESDFANFTYMGYTVTVHSCQECWVTPGWYSQTYQRKLQDTAFGLDDSGSSIVQLACVVTGYDGQKVTGWTGDASTGSGSSSNLGRRQGDFIEFPSYANLTGVRWYWGTPPNGDFVPPGSVGVGYVSPGYL